MQKIAVLWEKNKMQKYNDNVSNYKYTHLYFKYKFCHASKGPASINWTDTAGNTGTATEAPQEHWNYFFFT